MLLVIQIQVQRDVLLSFVVMIESNVSKSPSSGEETP